VSALTNPVIGGGGAHGRSAVVRQTSRLFSTLFQGADPKHRLTVLDTGAAMPETIAFLGRFKCSIHVCDLFSEPLVREMQQDLSEREMKKEFQDLLRFGIGTLLDICLFWDFLNYLSRPALRAFSAALKPYVHPGTRAHGFSVLNVETPLRNQRYAIGDENTLCVRPAKAPQPDYYPHSHDELNQSLSCFNVSRGWLLPDGRLEILLKAVV